MTRTTTNGRDQWGQAAHDQRLRMIEQMPIERAPANGGKYMALTWAIIIIMSVVIWTAIIGFLHDLFRMPLWRMQRPCPLCA